MVTKETGNALQTLISVVTLLVESAESVAESTSNPEARDSIFEYSKKVSFFFNKDH